MEQLMNRRRWPQWLLALCLSTLALGAAHAAPDLVWDSFDEPDPAHVDVVNGTNVLFYRDFIGSVPGGVRETTFNLYSNPNNGDAAFGLGFGALTLLHGDSQALGETVVGYGAFTRPSGDPNVGGPLLGLDLSSFNSVRLDFAAMDRYVNAIAVFYTSAPLDLGNPLYYSAAFSAGQAPAVAGGPNTLFLPLGDKSSFNWAQVDGMVLVLDRATDITGNTYALDTITLTAAIPEPGTWALMALGLAAVGLRQRQNRSRA